MPDTCPHCGAAMLFVPAPSRAENAVGCANCEFWEEKVVRYDGAVLMCGHMPDGEEEWTEDTIVAVGHAPESANRQALRDSSVEEAEG